LGLTGMIGPSKPPFMRFAISAAPTDFGRTDAPMTAIDRGRNSLSRLRIDMAAFSSSVVRKWAGSFLIIDAS
jgi:hypothetical protein